jgi:hypothetical protein
MGVFTGTATATLVDLGGPGRESRSTVIAALVNMGGLSLGPLLAGGLSEWVAMPLRLPFWVDLALLALAAICVWAIPEPVTHRTRPRLRPQRLHVPRAMRATFAKAGLIAFVGFAVQGLFTGVASVFLPAVLDVHFLVFASSAAGTLIQGRMQALTAMRIGCAGLVLGMGVIFLSLAIESLPLLIVGGIVAGLMQGLAFRAALFTVNAAAPPENRAEVASSFFVVAYIGLSVPVVGVGLLADLTDLRTAGLTFTVVVAIASAVALALLGRERDPRPATH